MTQYARPDASGVLSNFTGAYTAIDETTPSSADYITGAGNANGSAIFGLSNVTDPVASSGHVIRYQAWQENATHQRTLAVHLIQGSSVVASAAAFNLVKGSATTYSATMSATEADAISDYTDLHIRFISGGTVSSPTASQSDVFVSWFELATPDPIPLLVVADAAHANASDSATLVSHTAVTVADAAHANAVESPTATVGPWRYDLTLLIESVALTVADATHGHTSDSGTLTSHAALVTADALHAHASDSATLVSHAALVLADALHGHAADNLSLTSAAELTVADALHAHASDSGTLTSHAVLVTADTLHAHVSDSATLGVEGTVALTVADATHANASDSATLVSHAVLVLADAAHANAAESPTATVGPWSYDLTRIVSSLTVQDALHGHTADNLTLPGSTALTVADATHAHAAESPTLPVHLCYTDAALPATWSTITYRVKATLDGASSEYDESNTLTAAALVVQDATHAHATDSATLVAHAELIVADALHAMLADEIAIIIQAELVVADALHALVSDSATLTFVPYPSGLHGKGGTVAGVAGAGSVTEGASGTGSTVPGVTGDGSSPAGTHGSTSVVRQVTGVMGV